MITLDQNKENSYFKSLLKKNSFQSQDEKIVQVQSFIRDSDKDVAKPFIEETLRRVEKISCWQNIPDYKYEQLREYLAGKDLKILREEAKTRGVSSFDVDRLSSALYDNLTIGDTGSLEGVCDLCAINDSLVLLTIHADLTVLVGGAITLPIVYGMLREENLLKSIKLTLGRLYVDAAIKRVSNVVMDNRGFITVGFLATGAVALQVTGAYTGNTEMLTPLDQTSSLFKIFSRELASRAFSGFTGQMVENSRDVLINVFYSLGRLLTAPLEGIQAGALQGGVDSMARAVGEVAKEAKK